MVRTAWQAVTLRPLAFLASWWPWRALAYLLSGVLLGAVTMTGLLVLVVGGALSAILLVGFVALPAFVLSGVVVARFERWRLRLVDADVPVNPHRPVGNWRKWPLARLREQATWREFGYTMLSVAGLWWIDLGMLGVTLGVPGVAISSPWWVTDEAGWWTAVPVLIGLVMTPVAAYPMTCWAAARGALTRAVLAPRDTEIGERLRDVSASRARLLSAFEVERRRIERDLHDGAQQRLVALTMNLGLARLDLEPGSAADARVAEAHGQAKQALADLRELIRGVHPHVLTDRGLEAAVRDVAGRSPVPVEVDVALPGRLPNAVEETAYYAACEALANVARHSGAARATVHARLREDVLVLEVRDDGRGGAAPGAGSGLIGLADRVAVGDGRLRLSSPAGGPTLVRVELPCVPH
ncbi:sensor histidine kinase [Catenuloplanes japonicus]|uniref:sensor histidine kinase n=1 Tax=Catenuloplanes japonicus TaxID=33876 RepID=UPI00052464EF|nr:sensor histidine kinase [Catenuloplanes japonicus]